MAKVKVRPGHKIPPAIGSIYYRTLAGQLIAQAKPRPRGRGGTAKQLEQQAWFADAAHAVRYFAPQLIWSAMKLTEHYHVMWRDELMKHMSGRFGSLLLEDGRIIHSLSEQQDVSDSLDAIGQATGNILFRAADKWTALPAGSPGWVLTAQGPDADVHWQPGTTTWELVETRVVAAVPAIAFVNLAPGFIHRWTLTDIGVSAPDATIFALVSDDNGATFKNSAYESMLAWQDHATATGATQTNGRILVIEGIGNNPETRGNAELNCLSNLGDTAIWKQFVSIATRWTDAPIFVRDFASGTYRGNTNALDAVAIGVNTGVYFGVISLERRAIL